MNLKSNPFFSMPKPIFHSNGKKTVHQRIQHCVLTPQHEEMIRFISESKSLLLLALH